MAGLKRPTAAEFHKLTWKQKTYYLACWYLDRCTEEALFVNGRPSKALGQVRGYFIYKVDPSKLQVLYDFVSSIEEKQDISMYDLYVRAEKHQVNLRMQNNSSNESVKPYESLLSRLEGL
jgi:hypothetical protein